MKVLVAAWIDDEKVTPESVGENLDALTVVGAAAGLALSGALGVIEGTVYTAIVGPEDNIDGILDTILDNTSEAAVLCSTAD